MSRAACLPLALALCAPLLAAPASAQAPAASAAAGASARSPALVEAVDALARTVAHYGGQVGVAIVDVDSGEVLAAHDEHRPLNPASNAKLFTAAAALAKLGPGHRFETALYGQVKGDRVGALVLRGHGDPSLATRDLWDMAHDLREAGVRRVDGDILVDQRFFDDNYVPPAFEQQPNEWAYFRAPVCATSLDENTVTMTVRPGAPGAAAGVSFDPPGFVDVDGTVRTGTDGHAQNVTLELAGAGMRLTAKVGGAIPASARPVHFVRRVENPALLAGYALKALLVAQGVAVAGEVKTGGESAHGALVVHRSAPLGVLVGEMGKQSDNFYAETIFKTLGAERKGRPGKSEAGAEIVTQYLGEIAALDEGTVIKNGSGLFDANRVTASTTARLLRAAYRDPATSAEMVSQLAIGGVDGTLHGRFRAHKADRRVRAKTGTLESVAALSGYVLGTTGHGPVAFSIFVNGVAGKVSGARAAIDKCVEAIAKATAR